MADGPVCFTLAQTFLVNSQLNLLQQIAAADKQTYLYILSVTNLATESVSRKTPIIRDLGNIGNTLCSLSYVS